MSATQAIRHPERVADWPRIVAGIHGASDRVVHGALVYTGSLTINGTERPCEAGSVEELRTGMIARCVAIAIRLHRAVRLTVNDSSQTWNLAVRPEGIVQLVDDAGTIPPAAGLSVHEGRCRICRRLQSVTEPVCVQCHAPEPHRVEAEPIDVQDVVPDAADAVDELQHTLAAQRSSSRVSRRTLRLTFSTQRAVDVDQNAAIGRNPEPVDGRLPVAVQSPRRMLSRTHALVDVDEQGRIIVTDHHSGNGIEAQTDPPRRLDPDVPYVIEPGTSLLMGDVVCTIEALR